MPEDKAQDNFTDPDSRIMKRAGGGFDASYNAQTAVDDTAHIIVAAELTNNACRRAATAADAAGGEGQPGRAARAGAGRCGLPQRSGVRGARRLRHDLVVALGREGKQALRDRSRTTHPHTAAMAAKLQTDAGKAAYRRRKWIAEPPNGWIKNVLGFRQFSLRGLHRVQAEFKLVCLALNLRRMAAM